MTESEIGSPVSGAELRRVLFGLGMALSLAALDQNIVATALPRIVGELGGLAHLSWVVTAFLVSSTATTPLYGRFSDLYGRKPAFAVSIGLFLIGSMACGLSDSMGQLIATRAVQGLGAGGLFVLAQTVLADLVSPRERGRYQGMFAAVFAIGSVAGPLLGGLITDALSWRWIFYVNLPVGLAALALIWTGLRPHVAPAQVTVDLKGAALLVGGTCCLLLMLSWGGVVLPWLSPLMIGLAAAGIGQFLLLGVVERRAAQPILPPGLFRNPVFMVATGTVTLAAMAMFAAAVFLPLMFQLLMGASPSRAGLMVSPLMAGVIVSSFVGGRLVSRLGRIKPFPILGLLCILCAYVVLATATREHGGPVPIEAALVGIGLGIGLIMPNLTTAIQNAVDRADIGVATAAATFFRSMGGALGVALAGALVGAKLRLLSDASADSIAQINHLLAPQRLAVMGAYRDGLVTAFIAGGCIALLGLAVVLFLPERPLRALR